jgi:hypothetical protein
MSIRESPRNLINDFLADFSLRNTLFLAYIYARRLRSLAPLCLKRFAGMALWGLRRIMCKAHTKTAQDTMHFCGYTIPVTDKINFQLIIRPMH